MLLRRLFGSDRPGTDGEDESRFAEEVEQTRRDLSALPDKSLDDFRDDVRSLNHESTSKRDAFALLGEISRRLRGETPYAEQYIAGHALYDKTIVEMPNGEGKTLAATFPAFLYTLEHSGGRVHIVTDNSYLARRDATNMGPLFTRAGATVGLVTDEGHEHVAAGKGDFVLEPCSPREAYSCDIVYADKAVLVTDYVRDHQMLFPRRRRIAKLDYAIIDEADSILIDAGDDVLSLGERTLDDPDVVTNRYRTANTLVASMHADADLVVDRRYGMITLTLSGESRCEAFLGVPSVYDDATNRWYRHVSLALRAHHLMREGAEYLVMGDEVVPLDKETGRLLRNERYTDGLHQALEAKHGIPIRPETFSTAAITVQNFFRSYERLAGMTGTASPHERHYRDVYGCRTKHIPPRKPIVRIAQHDLLYRTEREKHRAVVREIVRLHERNQPVLVGTQTPRDANTIVTALREMGIEAELLTAREHDREAAIIAGAGQPGSVVVAARLAGRGTDILVNDACFLRKCDLCPASSDTPQSPQQRQICEQDLACGLAVIGDGRGDIRSDGQLAGRTGRRGLPGRTQFFLSLEDDLMTKFGSERIQEFMRFLGMEEDVPIEHSMVVNAIARAQRQLQAASYTRFRSLFRRDLVLDSYRARFYLFRESLLSAPDISAVVQQIVTSFGAGCRRRFLPAARARWDIEALRGALHAIGFAAEMLVGIAASRDSGEVERTIRERLSSLLAERQEIIGRVEPFDLRAFVLVEALDRSWAWFLAELARLQGKLVIAEASDDAVTHRLAKEIRNLHDRMLENAERQFLTRLIGETATPEVLLGRIIDIAINENDWDAAHSLVACADRVAATDAAAKLISRVAYQLWTANRSGEAEQTLRDRLLVEPHETSTINMLGFLLNRSERFEESRQLLETAIEGNAGDKETLRHLGWALYQIGDFAGSIARYRSAVGEDFERLTEVPELITILAEGDQLDEAVRASLILAIRQPSADSLRKLVDYALASGRRADILDYIGKHFENADVSAGVCLEIGEHVLIEHKDPSLAVPFLARGVEIDPDEAMLRMYLGDSYQQIGDLVHALREYEAAVALRPPYVRWALYRSGEVQQKLAEHEAAIRSFDRALAEDDAWPGAFLLRARSRLFLRDHEAAFEDLRRAHAEVGPDDRKTADLFGDVLDEVDVPLPPDLLERKMNLTRSSRGNIQ